MQKIREVRQTVIKPIDDFMWNDDKTRGRMLMRQELL